MKNQKVVEQPVGGAVQGGAQIDETLAIGAKPRDVTSFASTTHHSTTPPAAGTDNYLCSEK